jgi:N-acetylglucosaminyldiphosphoundecaprenol N-acetyl-beta-D-mannosaminyltransferase
MDFILNLMPLAQEKNWRIFFLGGKDDVPEFAKKVLQNKYSNLQIVGAETGPFWHEDELKANEELKELVNKINNSQADILLVAFGAPKQEKFIDFFRNDLNVKVAIGVGGSLDYISGLVPRAPEWIRQVGLEWLYRLFKQPSRIKRIFTATIIFPILVLAKGRKNA